MYVSQLVGIVSSMFYTLTALNVLGKTQARPQVQRQTQTADESGDGIDIVLNNAQPYMASDDIGITTPFGEASDAIRGRDKDDSASNAERIQHHMELLIMVSNEPSV